MSTPAEGGSLPATVAEIAAQMASGDTNPRKTVAASFARMRETKAGGDGLNAVL